MKLTKEILTNLIKEEVREGKESWLNEPEITQDKWIALGDLLNWSAQKEAIENYFKNQNSRDWKAASEELSSMFGERAEEIKSILRKKDMPK